MAAFLDRQYLWKEYIDILVFFLQKDSHQGKVAYVTTTFGRMCPGEPLFQSDCRFLDQLYHWKKPVKSVISQEISEL